MPIPRCVPIQILEKERKVARIKLIFRWLSGHKYNSAEVYARRDKELIREKANIGG